MPKRKFPQRALQVRWRCRCERKHTHTHMRCDRTYICCAYATVYLYIHYKLTSSLSRISGDEFTTYNKTDGTRCSKLTFQTLSLIWTDRDHRTGVCSSRCCSSAVNLLHHWDFNMLSRERSYSTTGCGTVPNRIIDCRVDARNASVLLSQMLIQITTFSSSSR